MIYFVEIEGSQSIKIGFTANDDVTDRIRQLQTGQPKKLNLIGTIAGGKDAESALHEQFADLRTNGEWFEGPPSFRWFLAYLAKNKLPWSFARAYDLLDAWKDEIADEMATSDWRDKQIARSHRRIKKYQDQISELEAEVSRLKEQLADSSLEAELEAACSKSFDPVFFPEN